MKPRLPDDDIGQYLSTEVRLKRLEQSISPEPTRYVGDVGQPPFQNGWINYDNSLTSPTTGYRNAGFYRHDGRVYLTGVIKSGTVGQAAFTLPVGYRPLETIGWDFAVNSAASFGLISVLPTGVVIPVVGSNAYFFLNQINFRHA